MDRPKGLTGQVRHGGQFLGPELGDLDGIVLPGLTLGRIALPIGMVQEPTEEIGLQRVEDIKEVIPWRASARRVLVGEVAHEDRILLELWVERLDGQLIILRHVNVSDISFLEQLFLSRQDCLEEIFIDHILVRQVVLQTRRN